MNRSRSPSRPQLAGTAVSAVAPPALRSKYGNIRCEVEVDGRLERFDSKAERDRYLMLRILERAGHITNLERQVTVDLQVNGVTVRQMRWDFGYSEGGRLILDDTKGAPATEGWLIKASFLLALRPEFELRVNGVRLK